MNRSLISCINYQVNKVELQNIIRTLIKPVLTKYKAKLEIHASLASTNDYILNKQNQQPLIVLTNHQTKGKGRQGKQWISQGDFYSLTFSLGVKLPIQRANILSITIAKILYYTLAELDLHHNLAIKLPNDLVRFNKHLTKLNVEDSCININATKASQTLTKIAGILIETKPIDDKNILGVIGIGINLLKNPKLNAIADNHQSASNIKMGYLFDDNSFFDKVNYSQIFAKIFCGLCGNILASLIDFQTVGLTQERQIKSLQANSNNPAPIFKVIS